jgi:hypothetical protein
VCGSGIILKWGCVGLRAWRCASADVWEASWFAKDPGFILVNLEVADVSVRSPLACHFSFAGVLRRKAAFLGVLM